METDDTYIYVDDTDRCVNEEDGMIYKIPVDNPRISRYLKNGKVGKEKTESRFLSEKIPLAFSCLLL